MVDPGIVFGSGLSIGGAFAAGFVATLRHRKATKLEGVVTELRRQVAFWEGQYRSRSTQYDEVCKINANLHDALRNANRLAGNQAIEIAELEIVLKKTQHGLAEAQKNDHRDAKGRFVKVAPSSMEVDWL